MTRLFYIMQAEGTSAESVAALARVDAVKQRMEAAHETLQVNINPHFVNMKASTERLP